MSSPRNTHRSRQAGFTLIEMIVACALFAVVMLVSTSALLSLVGANRKAQALQAVMNNLNVALDGMVRAMRMGSEYYCGTSIPGNVSSISGTRDCDGGIIFSFRTFEGARWTYWYEEEDGIGRIYKLESEWGESENLSRGVAVTAPTVDIENLKFYVVGTDSGDEDADQIQPKAVISIKGIAGADNVKVRTEFTVQATAVQRVLDL